MAQHRKAMSTRQTRRSTAGNRDPLARGRATLERLHARGKEMVGRVTLKRADIDRLILGQVAHACLLAQDFRRADSRAGAAENVLLEDRDRRALDIAGGDLAHECRDIDAGGAGLDAGGIVAEIAAAGIDERPLGIQRRLDIAEIDLVLGRAQPAGEDIRGAIVHPQPLLAIVQSMTSLWTDANPNSNLTKRSISD